MIEAPSPTPAHYRPLLGLYARPDLGGWVLRLEWRGKLAFVTPEVAAWCLELEPTGDPESFTVRPGSSFAGENVTFQRLAGGRVISVLLVESTLLRMDRVPGSG